MLIKRDELPTEGVVINGIHFLPGKPTKVDDVLGESLVQHKGFKRAEPTKTKKEE